MRRYGEDRYRRDPEGIDVRLEVLRSSDSSPKKQAGKPKRRRGRRRSPAGAFFLLTLLLISILYGGYLLAGVVFGGGEEAEPVTVVVEKGDTLSSVADKLEEAGVVSSSTYFKLKVRLQGEDTEIKPGEYRFMPGEDSEKIQQTLSTNGFASTLEVTIPEGLTLKQTAQVVEEGTEIPAEEFEAAAKETDYGYAFLEDPAVESTEGFLFPKKYEFEQGVDATQVVNRLLEQYLIETKDLDFKAAQDRFNLSEYELVTTASLIEKEAANDEERPLIASVIYNRIRARMPLQIDASIHYALGEPKEKLSLDDLEIDSPYNTYKNPGLPPGPIASPSRESIRAALEPAKTDYLYYVLEADRKEHFFTNDYDEFLEAKADAESER